MYSNVKLAGHPIHPMLVSFPIAFYAASCAAFIAYALGADPFWFRLAVYADVAGVITALIAAIPGFIDWAVGVPTGSPAKATGLAHMICNVGALVAFALNGWLQWGHRLDPVPPVGASFVLPIAGLLLTLAAGYFGWTMVQKHHVGIDLTPEQERLEPRASPRIEREPTTPGTTHGHQLR
jgi:uncharacterized membrane protein